MGRMGGGLRANKRFEKGDFVIEYAGEMIHSEQKANERRQELLDSGRDTCFVMKFQVANGKYKWSVTFGIFVPSPNVFQFECYSFSHYHTSRL